MGRREHRRVAAAGAAARSTKTDLVVLELSSYMLDYLAPMRWSPHVAVVTMIAPDHLEWHGSFEAYSRPRGTSSRFQRPDDVAVANEENAAAGRAGAAVAGPKDRATASRAAGRSSCAARAAQPAQRPGRFAAASVLGVTWDEAQAALREFAGLPHRLELVHEQGGVR